jgi:hypothetical protein
MAIGLVDSVQNGTGANSYLLAGTSFVAVTFGLLLLSATAPTTLTVERVRGSLDILMSTPLSTHQIVLGKWLGSFRRVPPLAILPLDPDNKTDLAAQLGLPRTPAEVAKALLAGSSRRIDLLRNDGGSVTLDGALLGGADDNGAAVPWRGRVEVDDNVLTEGEEPILACAIGNGGGYAEFDGLRLLAEGNPADGRVEVAVAVPVVVKQRFKGTRVRIEVRRARGRAVSVLPREGELQFLDDGVAGSTTRKKSWWTEAGAWAVYAN